MDFNDYAARHNMFDKAIEQVRTKKNPPALSKLRLEEFTEGQATQVTYVGSYSNEGSTIQKLYEFIKKGGGKLHGAARKHH